MCTSPILVGRSKFPCGHCDECRKAEEYRLGLVGIANLNDYHDVFSVTLTYDEQNIPLAVKSLFIDYSQGCYFIVDNFISEVRSNYSSLVLTPEGLRQIWLDREHDDTLGCVLLSDNLYSYKSIKDCFDNLRKNFYFSGYKTFEEVSYADYFDNPFVEIYSLLCPIADISHVQKWLKRFRETHFRMHGYRPDISYTGVAEYGPLRCRPHYHFCIFANDVDADLLRAFVTNKPYLGEFMSGSWSLGFGVVKHTDKSDLCYARNMSKYVAKYGKKLEKGVHVLEAIHVVPSFRRITSKGYYDAIKKFVASTILRNIPFRDYMDTLDDSYVPDQDIDLDYYAMVVADRLQQKYTLCGKQFYIPRSFVADILTKQYSYEYTCAGYTIKGEKILYEVSRVRSQKSILWSAVVYYERTCDLQNTMRECWKIADEQGISFYSAFDEITALQARVADDRKCRDRSYIHERYKEHAVV